HHDVLSRNESGQDWKLDFVFDLGSNATLSVNGTAMHVVRPGGAEHLNDATMGGPASLDFTTISAAKQITTKLPDMRITNSAQHPGNPPHTDAYDATLSNVGIDDDSDA